MKIVLTGGGTGGHFYPLIAVAEAIHDIVDERTLIEPQLYYMGPAPFDVTALTERDIVHVPSMAGRTTAFGMFKNFFGIVRATTQLFNLYPDIVFSTGGYAAFPTLMAARILKIPVMIYDADAEPGKVSLWASSFARYIAVAHPDAAEKFPQKVREKIARTGHPIRKELEHLVREGAHEFLKLDATLPTILVMGGSTGAQKINEALLDALVDLTARYNVVHQAGRNNVEECENIASVILRGSGKESRYRAFGLLNALALRMAAGIADIVVSRAGSGAIFEIATWGIPSLIIPIPRETSHDQTDNAFSYARSGAAIVLEQHNLTPHLLVAEIDRLMNYTAKRDMMRTKAAEYARPHASVTIAKTLIDTALEHEQV